MTRFLYNGRCGVATDDNGLYYMRQRYYNTEIKRFVNQDILTGSAGNSQSLNRYSYVQGNPVKYTDPFGLSPINGLFSGSNIRHALLGFASCIPVIGVIASAADAWFYYKEGNTAMAMACTVDAVIGLLSGGGSLLTKFAKTEQIGRAIQVAAKIGNGGVGLYRNATTFGKSAVDFYVRHEGTFFTKNFQWELADAGDFLSMALSGAGAAQSAAGLASGINDAAKAYRQWKEIDALKNIREGGNAAHDLVQYEKLKEYYRQAEKYGTGSIKELDDGRIRFYEELKPASKPGEMAGARHVREWDSNTGSKRDWYETLDHNGNIRQVRPDPKLTGGIKVHYMFDTIGEYIGKWFPE